VRTRKETAPRSTTSEGWGGQKEEEENPLSPHPQPPGKFPLFPSLSSHLVHRLEPPGVVVRVRHEVDVELALGAVRSSFEVGKRGRGGEKSWVSVVGGGCFGQGGDDDPSKLERARFAPFRSTLLLDSNLQCVSSPFRGRVVDGRDACLLARVVVAARATMVSMLLALMAEIAPPVASSLQEAKRRERRSLFRRQLQRALRGARCARREEQREEQREQSARATARLHPWLAGRVFFFFSRVRAQSKTFPLFASFSCRRRLRRRKNL